MTGKGELWHTKEEEFLDNIYFLLMLKEISLNESHCHHPLLPISRVTIYELESIIQLYQNIPIPDYTRTLSLVLTLS